MEDSFRVRVDKAFGALSTASATTAAPPSSNLSSLWSLTDDEIERKEWNRVKDISELEPESETDLTLWKKGFLSRNRQNSDLDLRAELEKDLNDLDDDNELDDELSRDGSRASSKPNDYNDEEWEIKNSIGLDCTLDYEEEEDQYDKVAVGKEKPGDRLYMKDVADYGINVDCNGELPVSFNGVSRDPRANHFAAKLRLKEDAEAAKKMDSLRVSEHHLADVVDGRVKASDDGNLKSILKRRDDESDSKLKSNQADLKSQKRVRFDPECKDGTDKESGEDDALMEDGKSLAFPLPPDYPSGIPDYMRNPSKYTRYTFDSSSDVDEQSNRQAFNDLMKMLNKSNTTESETDDASDDFPKSVIFRPKRKIGDTEMIDNQISSKQNNGEASKEASHRKGVSIAAADVDDSEPSAMEEDEPAADRRNSSLRAGRKYRNKAKLETEDSV